MRSRAQLRQRRRRLLVLVTRCGNTMQAQATVPRSRCRCVDLAELPRIAGAPPQLSPDGKPLAYLLTRTDWKAGRLIFQLWRQERRPAARRCSSRSATGGVQPGALRWSPDGKTLLFLRDGQIALLPLDGGEPRALHETRDHERRASPAVVA